MATQKQIDANRRNAQKSTGPKTPEGKARASRNALRHGLTAQTVVLNEEDAGAYEAIRESLVEAYAPVGAAELMLVDQVATAYWRTIRARRMEKAILDQRPDDLLSIFDSCFKTYFRYDSAISRDYYRALSALERAQEHRRRDERSSHKTKPVPSVPESEESSDSDDLQPAPSRRIGSVSQPERLTVVASPAVVPREQYTT